MGAGPQPACPAISVTKSHFKAPNKEPPAQHPFLLPDSPHRPPFPISLAVWRLSLRPIPSGQSLPAPVRAAPGSPGPPPRGWGLEASWRVADPCSTSRRGGRGGGRQPQVRGAGAKRTHGPGRQEAAPVTGSGCSSTKRRAEAAGVAQRVTVARRGMRGARGWGHRRHRHQGRRLERGAQSPARPREAAKDGLDRRAARRPHTRAPTPGLRAGPAPQPPGAGRWGVGSLLPSGTSRSGRQRRETSSLPRRE